jgi:hypothetical protein
MPGVGLTRGKEGIGFARGLRFFGGKTAVHRPGGGGLCCDLVGLIQLVDKITSMLNLPTSVGTVVLVLLGFQPCCSLRGYNSFRLWMVAQREMIRELEWALNRRARRRDRAGVVSAACIGDGRANAASPGISHTRWNCSYLCFQLARNFDGIGLAKYPAPVRNRPASNNVGR